MLLILSIIEIFNLDLDSNNYTTKREFPKYNTSWVDVVNIDESFTMKLLVLWFNQSIVQFECKLFDEHDNSLIYVISSWTLRIELSL